VIVKRVEIKCDADGCSQWESSLHGTQALARRTFSRIGWRKRGGKDYCPRCAKAGLGLSAKAVGDA
jgi:hypothetical protein